MIVQRRGGTVALKALREAIRQVQVGTDKTAAELAIARLDREYAYAYGQLSLFPTPSGAGLLLMRGFVFVVLLLVGSILTFKISGSLEPKLGGIVGILLWFVVLGGSAWIAFFIVTGPQVSVDPRRSAIEFQLIQIKNEIDRNRAIVQEGTHQRRCPTCRNSVGLLAKHCTTCGTALV